MFVSLLNVYKIPATSDRAASDSQVSAETETESPIAYFVFAGVLGSSDKLIKRVAEATYEQVDTADTLAEVVSSEGRSNFWGRSRDHELLHI